VPDEAEPPKRSYTFLVVCGGLALLILIGAAIYIGLDLRSANRATAEREAADNAPRPAVSGCPGGARHGCAPGRTLPVTFEHWLAGTSLGIVSTGDEQRTGTNVLQIGYPGGSLQAHVSHEKSVLYEVDCELTADPGSSGPFNADAQAMLRDCAGSTLPADGDYASRSLTWIGMTLAGPATGRWNCGAIAMQSRSEPNHLEIDVFPATDPNYCGAA
jgi:hypothetical protein